VNSRTRENHSKTGNKKVLSGWFVLLTATGKCHAAALLGLVVGTSGLIHSLAETNPFSSIDARSTGVLDFNCANPAGTILSPAVTPASLQIIISSKREKPAEHPSQYKN